MKCPHCLTKIYPSPENQQIGNDKDGLWGSIRIKCPACNRLFIYLVNVESMDYSAGWRFGKVKKKFLIYPKGASRPAPPIEVSEDFKVDYIKACLVISDSSKASAALSRRCLQHILREKVGVKKSSLGNEIQEVLNSKQLPSYIADAIDGIRNIGNFAAHPIKSNSSGEIVEVEEGEAEWNLDVIESLFDFYFVQPAKLKAKQDALNKKLVSAGKPNMKVST